MSIFGVGNTLTNMEDESEIALHQRSTIGSAYVECTDDAVFFVHGSMIVYRNPRAIELFGSPDSSTSSEGTVRTIDGLLGITVPEVSGGCATMETSCHRADGTTFPVVVRVMPVSPGRRLVVVRDQSERVATEEMLRRRSAQLSATMESLPFDFWINDRDNRTLFQNRYSLALWGDQRGNAPEDVTDDPVILEEWKRSNARVFAGEVHHGEITYEIDGRRRTFRNIVAPVRDGDETIGIVGLNIDITDYLDVTRDREILLRELHHRVKNNLQIILSTISYGRNADRFDPSGLLNRIEHYVHAIYLVHEQLYIGNELSSVDVGEYVRNLGASLDEALAFRSRIHVRSEPVRIPIEKAVPLGIALSELLANAARFGVAADPGGTLPIAVSIGTVPVDREERLRVSVENPLLDGFEPAPPSQYGGLAIVSHLLDQLGGSVTTACAAGTFTVSVEFPR